jgi:peptide/nickel transport system substrate-binding protein
LLWNQQFRQAISFAVDRERIQSTVFLGTGEPRQFAMPPDGPEYKSDRGQQVYQAWSKNWTQHDPAQAASLLDGVGVKLPSGGQWRTKPDGSPLELIVDVAVDDSTGSKTMQLVQEDWQKVGLKTTLNVIDGTLVSQRALDGSAMLRERGGAASGILIAPGHWTPVENQEYVAIGAKYGLYYESNGQKGLQPPPGSFVDKLQKTFSAALAEPDETKRNSLILDAYQVHVDNGPLLLGFVGLVKIPVIRKNTMRNVMKTGMLCSWHYSQPNASDPEQWYSKA